jgi:hypothetical protein
MAHSAAGGVGFGAGKEPIMEKCRSDVINSPLQVPPSAAVWSERFSDMTLAHDSELLISHGPGVHRLFIFICSVCSNILTRMLIYHCLAALYRVLLDKVKYSSGREEGG